MKPRYNALYLLLASLFLLGSCTAAPTISPTSTPTQPTPVVQASPVPQPSPTSATAWVIPASIQPDLSGAIIIDGSSTVFPITEAVARAFATIAPNVDIRLGVSGTGGGFKKFCAGETVISDASRPIKASEREVCDANGITFIELPVAFDGLTVVVNPQNTWLNCITVQSLKRMWEPAAESALLRWNQLDATWPNQPLALYGPGDDSGTHDYFTAAIVGEEGANRRDYTASEDDYVLAQNVSKNPNALGYFGYAYYREYQDELRVVAIDNGQGCVAPSPETINDGSYQPLSRPIFIYVNAKELERPELRAFVDFYLSNGKTLSSQARYVPLPERAYELALRRVEQQKLGSIFADGVQIGVKIEDLLEQEGK